MRLNKVFALKVKEVGHVLGLEVSHSATQLSINIEPYITKLIDQYGLTNSNPVSTPGAPNVYMLPSVEPMSQQVSELRRTYMELVGSLMYASTAARPDIAQQVSELGRHMSNPNKEHLNAAMRVLRYLKGTKSLSLNYYSCDSSILSAYVDADFASDTTSRKSRTGFLIMLGDSVIDWKSVKQPSVSLSTFASETVALSELARVLIPYRVLLRELGVEQSSPTLVHEDNTAARLFAMEGSGLKKLKHIDIRHRFVQEAVEKGEIVVQQCPTQDMLADLLTKPLTPVTFRKLLGSIFR
jgi:hypothetical protein